MVFRGMLAVLAVLACSGEPKRSYCEALCDWAVTCQGTEREVDAEALTTACLDATRASDASCEKAETGKMDPASAKLLEPCVNAIDDNEASATCDGFVGSIDALKTATAPASCASQAGDAVATFDAARDATTETGTELCQRYAETFCGRSEECILGDFGGQIPQAAIDAMGGTPYDLCVERLDQAFTADCIGADLYRAEENLTDVNLARQAARECLRDFTSISCDDLYAGNLETHSASCVGSVSDPQDLATIAQTMLELSQEFAAYAR
ncbi:MAG: hypothetical protein ABMB14_40300 [Myxococcota bacterium]